MEKKTCLYAELGDADLTLSSRLHDGHTHTTDPWPGMKKEAAIMHSDAKKALLTLINCVGGKADSCVQAPAAAGHAGLLRQGE